MNVIVLKKFNNYFNRIIKNYDTIDEYLNHCEDYEFTEVVNFMSKDGISTSQVFNMKKDFVPDYCLVIEPSKTGGFEILSKWFITEWVKISGKQYQAELHNDVIANSFKDIIDAPIFIEKGHLNQINPLLFNSENMTFNQIKKREIMLKDQSRIGWLVGYYVQDDAEDKIFKSTYDYIEGGEPIINFEDISSDIHINFPNTPIATPTRTKPKNRGVRMYAMADKTQYLVDYNIYEEAVNTLKTTSDFKPTWTNLLAFKDSDKTRFENSMFNYFERNMLIYNTIFLYSGDYDVFSGVDELEIRKLNNRVVKYQDKLYRIKIGTEKLKAAEYQVIFKKNDADTSDIASSLMQSNYSREFYHVSTNLGEPYDKPCTQLYANYNSYTIYAYPVETQKKQVSTTFTKTRNHLNDAPYDMFCIPYDKFEKETRYLITDELENVKIRNELSLVMAKGIASQSGGVGAATTLVYDLQLLPYCPIPEVLNSLTINDDGSMTFNLKAIEGFKKDKDYNIIYDTTGDVKSDPVGIVFWANKASGTFNIPFKYLVSADSVERKIQNECEFLRLCSPNYSGLFEFSPAKNDGVDSINVDYTYKPYNPYIHLNPNFKGLYGADFNDSRGLVVGGDFSIGTVTDRFAQYELNNKNYQQMFDREIQNMDVNNSLGLTKQVAGGLMGVGGGALAGAIGGSKGGPVGMIAGGITGGLGATLGMAIDIGVNQAGYRESKQYKTDMFGYTLGNIKALPASLSKTTAFTFNNKVYPFIEVYDCTDIEKQALRDKIKYDGMTIMAISTIRKFMGVDEPRFIKGKIIRFTKLADDSHVASVIFDELDKGVYI